MATSASHSFGTLLRSYRRSAGLTQEQLAERAGMSVEGISALERMLIRTPRQQTITGLAAALALSDEQRTDLITSAHPRSSAQDPLNGKVLQSDRVQGRICYEPLVGRARELAALERYLTTPGAPVLFITGEPGIGKTALLHAALRIASRLGIPSLSSDCGRANTHEPYEPLANLRAPSENALTTAPKSETSDAMPPERLFAHALERFCAPVPCLPHRLLVVDDAQWASAGLIEHVHRLARSTGVGHLHVLIAYQEAGRERTGALADLVADLLRAGLATRMPLLPLACEDAEVLCRVTLNQATPGEEVTSVEPAAIERMVELAEGVPFFLISYATTIAMGARAVLYGAVPDAILRSIRQCVGGEVSENMRYSAWRR